jgi:hypothetical protein
LQGGAGGRLDERVGRRTLAADRGRAAIDATRAVSATMKRKKLDLAAVQRPYREA